MSAEEGGVTKADIIEIKSLSKPPRVVQTVTGAYGIMVGIGPEWAATKKYVSDIKCIENIKAFDQLPATEIPAERKRKARKMLKGLTKEEVMKVSAACCGLFVLCQKKLGLDGEKSRVESLEENCIHPELTTVPRTIFRSEYVQKGNFTEIKAFDNPPQIVKEVMTCFGILVGIENPYDWVAIRKGLAASDFYKNKLGGFDIDKVDKKTVRASKSHFKRYVNQSIEKIKSISCAAAAIAKWCVEVYTYRPEEPPLSRQGTQLKMIFNLQVVDIQG